MEMQAIGWVNTALPVAALVGLAVLLPWLLVPRQTLSQRVLALAIAGSAGLLLAAGVGIFLASYAAMGADFFGAFATHPLGTWLMLVRVSALSALAWGPILALIWFVRAQGVEQRRGEAAMRESRG